MLKDILIPQWRDAHRLWSVRLIALSTLLTGVEFILPIFMTDPPVGRGVFAGFAFFVCIAAAIARLVAQKKMGQP